MAKRKAPGLLTARPTAMLEGFMNRWEKVPGVDLTGMPETIETLMRYYNGDQSARDDMQYLMRVENAWYSALKRGEIDWSIYDDNEYPAELWACWLIYSRKYLRSLLNPNGLKKGASVYDRLEGVQSVVDLGCGLGYTTAALKQMYPEARVFGTNIEGTGQFEFCKGMASDHGFAIVADPTSIEGGIDLVFASEYFEHIERPIEHLFSILDSQHPRYLVIANAFNARAPGHFSVYGHGADSEIPNTQIGKLFTAALRSRGFEKLNTKLWNNRPQIWVLKTERESMSEPEAADPTPKKKPKAAVGSKRPTVEHLPIADLKPHPQNYRTHPEDQLAHIIESIRANGFYRNVVVAKDGTILAGHGVVEASKAMKVKTVPAIKLPLAPDDPRALKILTGDNGIAHLGEVDDRILTDLLKDLQAFEDGLLGTGYDDAMLANLLYVTRSQDEIADMDVAAAWAGAGMPNYDTQAQTQLLIQFRTNEDREAFVKQTKLVVTAKGEKTWSTWWPDKEVDDASALQYEG